MPTFVVLQLGPTRGNATIVLVDHPSYAHASTLAEYKPNNMHVGEAQKQAAAIRRLFTTAAKGRPVADHSVAKLLAGVCPSVFAADPYSCSRDIYNFVAI